MKKGGKLRVEKSIECSGKLFSQSRIPLLKEDEYLVKEDELDGDAPKQFIRAYFYEQDSTVKKSSLNSWPKYIAKTAEKWYPHESVIEYLINRIGQEMSLNMNEVKLVKANKQIRFLSRYFLSKGEKLVHGAEICGEHLGDIPMAQEIANNKSTSRELFTFEFIKDSIRSVFPVCFEDLLIGLVEMIVFDAIVGNNDRHFYNWGVIDNMKKSNKIPTFAPLYDSARGLLWNHSDTNIKNIFNSYRAGGKRIDKYIDEASPRISIEDNTKANHFELVAFLKRYNNEYLEIVDSLSDLETERKVINMLNKEFAQFFTRERFELIVLILNKRFEKVRRV
jgi:uncharacterized protein (DUF779 family)